MSLWSRVKAALSRAPATGKSAPKGRVVQDQALWNQFQRIGGSLTPSEVSSIIREADTGDMRRLMDLANEARQKDCHLQTVLATNDECIAGLEWELFLPENALARDKKAAKWVEEKLRANASFSKLIAHLAGAIYYGYSVAEIEWTVDTDSKQVPKEFHSLSHRRFGFDQQTGAFVWREPDAGMTEGVEFLKKYPRKFVVSRPRVNGDVPCREGLVRVLMWAALFRNWTLGDWVRLGEIAWKPWRIGTYSKKEYASQEDVDGLVAVLEGMSTNGVAAVPDTVKVAVEWPPNQSNKSTHAELFDVTAKEMSKAVLGQTETTESSQSSGYAQSKTHDGVRKDLRATRARAIALDITRDVVTAMIEMNFGPSTEIPAFRFITQDPLDFAAFSKGVKDLKDAGAKIPQKWVRDQAGIPEPKDDEEILGDDDVDIPIDPKTGLPQEPPPTPPGSPPGKPPVKAKKKAEEDDAKQAA